MPGPVTHGIAENLIDIYLMNHEEWLNPMDVQIRSRVSFINLYQMALLECAKILQNLEELCMQEEITREKVCSIVPNIASTHGLACGKIIEIKYVK